MRKLAEGTDDESRERGSINRAVPTTETLGSPSPNSAKAVRSHLLSAMLSDEQLGGFVRSHEIK